MVLDAVDVKAAARDRRRGPSRPSIPVISYGRLVSDADLDYYVSIDPYKVGQQQGRRSLDALKAAGKPTRRVVMINGSPTDSNAPPYKKGAHSVLDKAGVEVRQGVTTRPTGARTRPRARWSRPITALGKNGFDGVYVANDGMATGAIAALKGASIDPPSASGHRAGRRGRGRAAHPRRRAAHDRLPADQEDRRHVGRARGAAGQGQDSRRSIATAKVDNGAEQVPVGAARHDRRSPRTTSTTRWSRTAS